ncbi:MAG: chemotaxis protein CheW [Alphaproteobacteria bacterium]
MTQPANDDAIGTRDLLTVAVNGQSFGLPVLAVQDVLGPQRITRIPLAPREIMGALNLRGRIVTAVDLRRRLSMPDRVPDAQHMSVVVDHHGEYYSVIVDNVGEVLSLSPEAFEHNPTTLDPRLKAVADGVYRLNKDILVVLDVRRLLEITREKAA